MKNLICVALAIVAMLVCGAVHACPPVAAPVAGQSVVVQSLGTPAVACPSVGVQSLAAQSVVVQSAPVFSQSVFGVQSFAPLAVHNLSVLGNPFVVQAVQPVVVQNVRQRHVQRAGFLNGLGFTNGFRNAAANILGVRGGGRSVSVQRSVNIQRIR